MPSRGRMLRPPGGSLKSDGTTGRMRVDRGVDGGGRFHRVLEHLQADPCAGEAAHRPAVEAVIENFLHAGRRQDRHHHIDEMELGLMRGGGGFRRVVVAHDDEHAAVFRRAGEIGVAEHVAATVDARSLAVPHREHAVVFAFAAHFGLLRAPDGGGGEILVEAGLELQVVGVEHLFGRVKGLVEAADGRTAIAGDIAGGVESRAAVHLFLHQHQPHDRLRARDENPGFRQIVFVGEGDVGEGGRMRVLRHFFLLPGLAALWRLIRR
jgi:hypothetical protein